MRKVVHIIKVVEGKLAIVACRVSDSLTYTPAQAVAILKRFPSLVVTVPVTSTSVIELYRRWESGDVAEEPTTIDKFKAAYLNQSGDMLFVSRELVARLIEDYQ